MAGGRHLMTLAAALAGWRAAAQDDARWCDLATDIDVREPAWVLYADQNCPSNTGYVDDMAIFEARTGAQRVELGALNASEANGAYEAQKTLSRLNRPVGLRLGGGALYWAEQDTGTLSRCKLDPRLGRCVGEVSTLMDGLNCPQDLVVDFQHSKIFIIHYGGGSGPDTHRRCGGDVRISRGAVERGAEGTSDLLDVVRAGVDVIKPVALAVDPLWGEGNKGLLFWSDYDAQCVVRSDLNGDGMRRVVSIAQPAGPREPDA